MTSSLPAGYIDTTAAVERIVRNARNGNLYSNWPADAWRKLCGELIPKGHVRPLMLTADGFVRKADVTQFAGFADKYSRFETFFGYQPSDRSYDLLDEHGRVHRFARAIFLESELEGELAPAREPTVDNPEVRETGDDDDGHVEESIRANVLQADHAADEPGAPGDEADDDIEAECDKWMAALPEDHRLKKKKARERFNRFRQNRKHIGTRAFNRVWKKSAPLSWHAPGRRPGT
jgi:hypothetical protein